MNCKTTAAVLGVLAAAFAQHAAAADAPSLRYAVGSEDIHSLSQLPLEIARTKGFFDKEGVRVEFVENAKSNAAAAEEGYNPSIERGGPADMTQVSAGYFVHAVLNGSDTVIISSQTNNPVYSVIARPEIKTFSDLKGKVLVLTSPWDTITLTTRKLLAMNSLKPGDVEFNSAIRGSQNRLDFIKSGKGAAIVAGQPADLHAIALGYHRLGMTNDAGAVIYDVVIVRPEWASAHKDAVVRYIRAVTDAMRFINDPKNRAEVEKTMGALTRETPEVVKEMMANYQNPKLNILPKNAGVDMASFKHFLELLKDSGVSTKPLPPAEHFVDLSYAKTAGVE